MLLYILIFVYLVGLTTMYIYFEEKIDEIKLLFLIFSIIVEFIVMLRELKLYNKVKNL